MKAWLVREKNEYCAEVVFAETRGKARALALLTDACEYANFTDIEVHREPQADKYYKEGKWRLDWADSDDRVVLFDECGFRCEYVEPFICNDCSVKELCEDYQESLAEEGGAEE